MLVVQEIFESICITVCMSHICILNTMGLAKMGPWKRTNQAELLFHMYWKGFLNLTDFVLQVTHCKITTELK